MEFVLEIDSVPPVRPMTSASSTPDQQFDEKLEEHIHTLLQIAKIAHDPPQDSATLHEQMYVFPVYSLTTGIVTFHHARQRDSGK